MNTLNDILFLGEGARLTGVVVLPLARESDSLRGSILVNVVIGSSEAGCEAGAAAARFLPTAVVVLHGAQADSRDWFATIEYVETEADVRLLSRAGFARAVDLIGIGMDRHTSSQQTAAELGETYEEVTGEPFDDWSVLDLTMGLVINLWVNDLAQVVDTLTTSSGASPAAAEERRRRIETTFHEWAATYRGT